MTTGSLRDGQLVCAAARAAVVAGVLVCFRLRIGNTPPLGCSLRLHGGRADNTNMQDSTAVNEQGAQQKPAWFCCPKQGSYQTDWLLQEAGWQRSRAWMLLLLLILLLHSTLQRAQAPSDGIWGLGLN